MITTRNGKAQAVPKLAAPNRQNVAALMKAAQQYNRSRGRNRITALENYVLVLATFTDTVLRAVPSREKLLSKTRKKAA